MTAAHYARLWTAIGFVLVFYSLNAWIASQGGRPFLDMELLEDRRALSGLVAIPICAVLLALLARIGVAHATATQPTMAPRTLWAARLPVVGLEGLDPASREGRLYQGFFLVLFIAVPIAALVHFLGRTLGLTAFRNAEVRTQISLFAWRSPFSGTTWDDGYRVGDGIPEGASVDGTVTWIPVVEPLAITMLILIALWQCRQLIDALFEPVDAWRIIGVALLAGAAFLVGWQAIGFTVVLLAIAYIWYRAR